MTSSFRRLFRGLFRKFVELAILHPDNVHNYFLTASSEAIFPSRMWITR
jgi:hypothetical protein